MKKATAAKLAPGFDSSRVIKLSSYSSTQAMCDAIVAMGGWYDEYDVNGTATCSNDSAAVTLTSSTVYSAKGARVGDIFSPDAGVSWFNVKAVSDSAITLRSPIETGAISGVSFRMARPKYRRVYLDDASKFSMLDLDSATPIFVQIINACGGVFGTTAAASAVRYTFRSPLQGAVLLNGVMAFAPYTQAQSINESPTPTAWHSGSAHWTDNVTNRTCHVEERNSAQRMSGVDVFYPGGGVGSIALIDGTYESCQDVMIPQVAGDYTIDRCKITGRTRLASGSLYLGINMFRVWPSRISNSTLTFAHAAGPANPYSSMFSTEQAGNSGKTCTLNSCTLNFTGQAGSNFYAMAKWSGADNHQAYGSLVMNSCVFNTAGLTSGTVEIVRVGTYSGSGALTMNQCTKTGTTDGGGGTFSITTNV